MDARIHGQQNRTNSFVCWVDVGVIQKQLQRELSNDAQAASTNIRVIVRVRPLVGHVRLPLPLCPAPVCAHVGCCTGARAGCAGCAVGSVLCRAAAGGGTGERCALPAAHPHLLCRPFQLVNESNQVSRRSFAFDHVFGPEASQVAFPPCIPSSVV